MYKEGQNIVDCTAQMYAYEQCQLTSMSTVKPKMADKLVGTKLKSSQFKHNLVRMDKLIHTALAKAFT